MNGDEPRQAGEHSDALTPERILTPKDLEAWQLHAQACQSVDLEQAVALCQQARELFGQKPMCEPGKAAVALTLGQLALLRGRPDEALPLFHECVKFWDGKAPTDAAAASSIHLGETYRRLEQSALALDAFQRALAISRQLPDQHGVIDRLLDVGLALAELERAREAIAALDEAITLAEAAADAERLSRGLERRGYVRMMKLSDFSEARQDWLRITTIGKPADQAAAWLQISGVDVLQDQPRDGISAVEKALSLYRQVGGANEVGVCLMRLADLYAAIGQSERAERLYVEATDIWRAAKNLPLEIQAGSQLGSLAWQQSHLEEAIARYGLVLQRAEEAGLHVEAAACCGALATIHQSLTHVDEADAYTRRAAEHRARMSDPSAVVERCIARARSIAAGRGQEALQQIEAHIAVFESHPDRTLAARLHRAAADVALGCEQAGAAISHAEAALRLYEALGMVQMTVTSELNLADIYEAASQSAKRSALARALERNLPDAARNARVALAKSLFDAGSFSEARVELRAALTAGAQNSPFLEATIHVGLSLVAERLGDDGEALEELRTGAKRLDAFRLDFAMPELAAGFVGAHVNIYHQLVRSALRTSAPATAFEYVEQSRSRAMLKLIGFSELQAPPSIAPELAGQERHWLKEAGAALARVQAKREDPHALNELRQAYEGLDAVWHAMGPSEYVAMRRGDTATYQETRDALAAESRRVVLVEFFCREKSTLVFGVRPDVDEPDVVHLRLDQADFGRFVRSNFGAREQVRLLASTAAHRLWQAFDFLITPIARWAKPGDVVYLVPHGLLHYLPLHGLALEGQPLIERNPVVYGPSASVLQYCRAKRGLGRAWRTAAVVGDSRDNLPGSRLEAEQVAVLFGVKPLLGADATMTAVEHAVRDVDVVHFAGHGYFNAQSPLDSGLLMAAGETFTARQVFGLRQFRGGLVTLSGCETGVSDVRPGDELMGLTRAFMAAGTPSVLASLWRVGDESTAFLMTQFYSYLLGSPPLTKAEALRRAMLDTRAQPGWAHLYHWAPFILVGDWR